MSEGEVGAGRRLRLDLLIEALGAAPVLEALQVDEERLSLVQAGLASLDRGESERLERMAESMGDVVEWWEDEPALSEVSGIELEEAGSGLDEELPAEGVASRSWSWEEHEGERRASLWAMHRLAMMTQPRLGIRYQSLLAIFELVAKIEWMLIYLGETLPEPGMDWGGNRRMRELNRRASRLLWVHREREHSGVRGLFNWLKGRPRMTPKELVQRMLVESDDIMGVLPEGGEVMGMRLPEAAERYGEAIGLVEEESGESRQGDGV